MTEMSPLRRRMIEDMTVRNLSPATQRSYVHAVARFGRFFSRSPDRLGLEEVRTFQVHLVAGGISWPALNQTVCALRFLYGVTLKQADLPERIPYARTPRKLPVVLGADEVVLFLEAVPSLKARAPLTTAYAAGLRADLDVVPCCQSSYRAARPMWCRLQKVSTSYVSKSRSSAFIFQLPWGCRAIMQVRSRQRISPERAAGHLHVTVRIDYGVWPFRWTIIGQGRSMKGCTLRLERTEVHASESCRRHS